MDSARKIVESGQKLGDLFLYTRNVNSLKTQIQELKGKQESLKDSIDKAERNGKRIGGGVQNWLSRADDIYHGAETFLNDVEGHAKASCSCGSAPSLALRNRLSRKAKMKVRAVRNLLDEGQGYVVKEEEVFDTRKPILVGIMEALRDPNVSVIGMYGMGGIGKTKFVEEVARQVKEEKLFSKVVAISVSQTPDVEVIQGEITEGIKCKEGRFNLLRDRAKQENNVLLILDDIWENLDLPLVGVHLQKGRKILLISRSLDVLCHMGAEKIFKLEVLSFSESIYLFNKTVGNIVEEQDFRSCGHEIVKECAGVPVAIETVACALKDKTLFHWKDVLLQLRQSNPTNIEGIFREVYSCFQRSFSLLTSEKASMLLLCSLHEEDQDIKVENLMRYSIGWGLFPELRTLEEARNKVQILVNKLKSCCLLLDGNCQDTVTMNKAVRNAATLYSSKEKHAHYIPNVAKLEECLEEEKLKESKAISLLEYDDFCHLNEGLACPELQLFLMLHAFNSLPMPDSFFEEANGLKILSLNGAGLELLPSSFFLLQNLGTLCLCSCDLGDIDLIGELKNLKILDLSDSTVKELPEKIGQLTRLRLLDLRGCRNLRAVRKNVISNLVSLEELYMAEEYDKWEVEGVNSTERSNANLTELKSLQQLTVLYLNIPDAKILPEGLFSRELERYRISVGGKWCFDGAGNSRSLYLRLDKRSQLNELGFQLLIERAQELVLDGFTSLGNVVYEVNENGSSIQRLHVLISDRVQDIIADFPSLESFYLRKLTDLESVYYHSPPANSFKQLREVRVANCDRLKNLFPLFIVKRLDYIEVEKCWSLEGIANDYLPLNDSHGDEIFELRFLTLKSLPKLVEFGTSAVQDSLFACCSDFEDVKVSFPKLEQLTLHGLNVGELWPRQLQSALHSFQNLKSLLVKDCHNLSFLLPFTLVKSLVQLEELRIHACCNMKVLVMTREELKEEERWEDISFSKLETLELRNLPELGRFCKAACFNCPSLLKLTIIGCEKLRLINFHKEHSMDNEIIEVTCPNLEELNLFEYLYPETVSNILQSRNLSALLMQTLTSLNLKRCQVKYLMPLTAAQRLQQLKYLEINDSYTIQEVVVVRKSFEMEETFGDSTLFPKLESLGLTDLLMLKSFCEADCRVELPSLLKLTVANCRKLKRLVTPFLPMLESGDDKELEEVDLEVKRHPLNETGVLMFPGSLEELNLSWMDIAKLWVDQLPSNPYMQNLKSLVVGNCHNLKFLFSSTAVGRLVQLKQLRVYECDLMEEVLVIKDGGEGPLMEDISFPKLESLELHNLPNLKSFCGEACVSCPSLLRLSVEECPNLVSIIITHAPAQRTIRKEIMDQEMDLLPGKSFQRMMSYPMEWDN